jgi:hypothetical protein
MRALGEGHSNQMKESEWKKFKRLKEICLERYCNAVIEEAQVVCKFEGKSNHERYIELYQLMRNRDKELGKAFNGLSRGQAHVQLMMMYRMGLVKENELDEFEPETKDNIRETIRTFNS